MAFVIMLAPFMLLLSTIQASANVATPIGKVVELLDALKEQIDTGGEEDSTAYRHFTAWYTNASAVANLTIQETQDQVDELTEGLNQDRAKIEELTGNINDKANELAKADQELQEATAQRNKEHDEYVKTQEMYDSALSQLSHALEVLAKQQPDSDGSPSGAALLSVAKKLRKTLETGKDIRLTSGQREILNTFFLEASKEQEESKAPDFMQVRRHSQADPVMYGEYESQSGGVVSTLEGVRDKASEEKDKSMKAEAEAARIFSELQQTLSTQIENLQTQVADLKTQLSETQQSAASREADLGTASKLLSSTQERLAELNQEYNDKTNNYKARTRKRSDELLAIQEATVILTSEAAKKYMANQTIGTADFLQIKQNNRRKALKVMRHCQSPGLMLLALKTQTTHGFQLGEDPFAKVKGLIQQMLEKLLTEANEEAEHKAFCDKEMGKSKHSLNDKQKDVAKLTDKIANMDAEINELAAELDELHATLAEMASSMEEATIVRNEEALAAKNALATYTDAQVLLKKAVTALKTFYEGESAKESNPDVPHEEQYKVQSGAATGIIGILEVAIQDFADQEKAAVTEETKAAKTFKELQSQTEISTAAFEKDLEYKSRSKVRLESEKVEAEGDLKSYEGEVAAVTKYLEELKSQCIAQPESYEERKARRETELESLKDALAILKGESVAPISDVGDV